MKYVFLNQNELMADIVIEILKSENISYRIESKKVGWGDSDYIYNITIETTPEYILFINKLVNEKLAPYRHAEKSFALPDFIPKHEEYNPIRLTVAVNQSMPILDMDKLHKELCNVVGVYDAQIINMPKKKSFLKKLVDWLTNFT